MSRLLLPLMLAAACWAGAAEPFNGMLLDVLGRPVKGARIYVSNPRRYALSDKQGRFGLTDVAPGDTLHVKVGKRKPVYEVPVEGRRSIRLYLADEGIDRAEADDRLVSLGYGYVKKREYTGASSGGITGEQLLRTGRFDILSALSGLVAGYDYNNGQPLIRGQKSLLYYTEPVYVVDGNIVGSLQGLNLHDVDYVEVLKDGSVYGSQGANGAIIVHTKGGAPR